MTCDGFPAILTAPTGSGFSEFFGNGLTLTLFRSIIRSEGGEVVDFSGFRCVRPRGAEYRPCDLKVITMPEYCHGQNCPYFKEVKKCEGHELQNGR